VRLSNEEIIQFAASQIKEEGDAEKVFREFDSALLTGKKESIKALIEDHSCSKSV